MRIAINGFGRIGRHFLRTFLDRGLGTQLSQPSNIEIVAINDIAAPDALTHLFQYDSSHGVFAQSAIFDAATSIMHCGTQCIKLIQHENSADCPWADLDIDVVIEATGVLRAYDDASKHITAGAKRVLMAAVPFDKADIIAVYDLNHETIKPEHKIISATSCTTHCLAPVLNVLETEWGIEQVLMTEVHAYTSDQQLLDHAHRDWRRARSGAQNIIPTTSSSIAAIQQVLPFMRGKIHGHSLRVPTPNVAAVDLAVQLKKIATVEEINTRFKQAAETSKVLGYNAQPLVSSDFNGCPESAIFDATLTQQTGDLVKIFSWYDNEIAYVHRLIDLLVYLDH